MSAVLIRPIIEPVIYHLVLLAGVCFPHTWQVNN